MRDHSHELCDTHTSELIDRYFLDGVPPAERERLREELQRAGIDMQRLGHMHSLWETGVREGVLSGDEWARRMAATGVLKSPSTIGKMRPVQSMPWSRAILGIAAATLLAVGIAGVFAHQQASRESGPAVASVYTTANGERATIMLPDSSTVMLSVATRLEVPADYAMGNRTLRLEGEALFTARPRAEAPFTVVSGPSVTRVLGTRFMVRHYRTDSTAVVAVQDGKVAVQSVVLTANQQIEVAMDGTHRIGDADPRQFGFAKGVLALNDVPLRDALVSLRRWYNVDIRLDHADIGARRVTGEFPPGSASDLASVLMMAFDGIRVEQHGRVLTLYSRQTR